MSFHSMARCCMDNGMRTDVPVYIPLKELSPSVSLENWLESFISRSDFGDAFSRGAVFLFLDGLNEVLPSVYDSTIRTISQFMKVYPDCGVVITSVCMVIQVNLIYRLSFARAYRR